MTKQSGSSATTWVAWIALTLAAGPAMAQSDGLEITFEPAADPPQMTAPPIAGGSPLQLVLDDGTAEGTVGVNGAAAQQFLWFNRFTPGVPPPFQLEEIQVLFPTGTNMAVGNVIDLVVYRDADGDPTNGAELLAIIPETIQILDGSTFSTYPLASPLLIENPGDVLIGVINRWVESGVDPPTQPAALDTTGSQGRSWIAIWTTDPPSTPNLPPDDLLDIIDVVAPPGGNWMIRGSGGSLPVPTMPHLGLVVLGSLLLLAGTLLLLRRQGLLE